MPSRPTFDLHNVYTTATPQDFPRPDIDIHILWHPRRKPFHPAPQPNLYQEMCPKYFFQTNQGVICTFCVLLDTMSKMTIWWSISTQPGHSSTNDDWRWQNIFCMFRIRCTPTAMAKEPPPPLETRALKDCKLQFCSYIYAIAFSALRCHLVGHVLGFRYPLVGRHLHSVAVVLLGAAKCPTFSGKIVQIPGQARHTSEVKWSSTTQSSRSKSMSSNATSNVTLLSIDIVFMYLQCY